MLVMAAESYRRRPLTERTARDVANVKTLSTRELSGSAVGRSHGARLGRGKGHEDRCEGEGNREHDDGLLGAVELASYRVLE